jgi:hypothetical protein
MGSVLTLLFAPSFLLFIQYFEFKTVTLVYIILSLFIFFYNYLQKTNYLDYVISMIYLVLLSLAYFTNSLNTVKFIPVFSSISFFTIFAYGALKKGEFIYNITKKFYKKDFSDAETLFLKSGDSFWAFSLLLYSIFLLVLIYTVEDSTWAFFSSIGWYIYFVLTLVIQIAYGKLYAIKMYTK